MIQSTTLSPHPARCILLQNTTPFAVSFPSLPTDVLLGFPGRSSSEISSPNHTLLLCFSLALPDFHILIAGSRFDSKSIASTSLRLPPCRAAIRRPDQVSDLILEILMWLRKLKYGWKYAGHPQSLSREEYGNFLAYRPGRYTDGRSRRPADLGNRSEHIQR